MSTTRADKLPRPLPGVPVRGSLILALLIIACILTGCWKDDMADDARIKPLEANNFFANGQSARPLVAGTVPRHGYMVTAPIYAVTHLPTTEATEFPKGLSITRDEIEQGHQLFNIYCAVCHGATGRGNGMIVQRGFPHPPSFYLDRLRNAPHGHFYNVISNGYGAMYSYGDRVAPTDRWKIVAYIRALQLSDKNDNGLADTPPTEKR